MMILNWTYSNRLIYVQSSGVTTEAPDPLRYCPAFDCDMAMGEPIADGNPTAATCREIENLILLNFLIEINFFFC